MKKLYSKKQFSDAKCKDKLPIECSYCHSTFYLEKHFIQISEKSKKFRTNDFCSTLCRNKSRSLEMVKCLCTNCKKPFLQHSYRIKSKNTFCSLSCSAIYNNSHKTKGTRVSKLEKWIQSKLSLIYPNIQFHFNRKDAISGELDIYIPSLKIAFELNGIFHYEAIYGEEKLLKMQSNDKRKFQACLENGIELCLIDTSQMSNFKEKKAQKYLDIILEILNQKILEHQTGLEPVTF